MFKVETGDSTQVVYGSVFPHAESCAGLVAGGGAGVSSSWLWQHSVTPDTNRRRYGTDIYIYISTAASMPRILILLIATLLDSQQETVGGLNEWGIFIICVRALLVRDMVESLVCDRFIPFLEGLDISCINVYLYILAPPFISHVACSWCWQCINCAELSEVLQSHLTDRRGSEELHTVSLSRQRGNWRAICYYYGNNLM